MKLTFFKEPDKNNPYDMSTVTLQIDAEGLEDILGEMTSFLKAIGFQISGSLEIVEEEDLQPPVHVTSNETAWGVTGDEELN